jgi:caffeoyl-CoA O-methyltransferase
MFGQSDERLLARMQYLESIDARDRVDSTAQAKRLRQVSPEVGKFIALLAAGAPPGRFIEIGTSAGYSALWLSLACRVGGRRLTTFEIDPGKVSLAQETFRESGVESIVDLVAGDARALVVGYSSIAFCFLDAAKDIYLDCYEKVVAAMVHGGLMVADNVVSHKRELTAFLDRALSDQRMDALVVPFGNGLLLCRKV